MTDELLDQIRRAGSVPPAPAREEAFRYAMRAVARRPLRLGPRRIVTAIAAAATLLVPAGVFQAVGKLDNAPDRVAPLVQPAPRVTPAATEAAATPSPGAREPEQTGPGVDPQPSRGQDATHGHKRGEGQAQAGEHSRASLHPSLRFAHRLF
ncbi:MAG: hypothetical protein ABR552_11230 [Actinomycetota bacterium]